jgi:hypothetical protein
MTVVAFSLSHFRSVLGRDAVVLVFGSVLYSHPRRGVTQCEPARSSSSSSSRAPHHRNLQPESDFATTGL